MCNLIADGSNTFTFSNLSLTCRSQITEILMGTLMGMVTMTTNIRYPPTVRSSRPRIKTLKPIHYSSTHLRQSVHPPETEMDAVPFLAPPRSPHSSAIQRRPVQPLSQLHNPWLLLRHPSCPHLLTGVRLHPLEAAQPALILDTTRFTLPLELWTTSRKSIVVLVPPMYGEGPCHPTSMAMGVHATMTMAVNPSSIPTP